MFLPEYSEDLKMAAGDLYKRIYDESLHPDKRKNTGKENRGEKVASFSKDRSSEEIRAEKRTAKRTGTGSQERIRRTDSGDRPKSRRIFRNIVQITWKCRQRSRKRKKSKRAYATRRLYMASIPAQEAAEYMAKVMDKKMRSMRGVSFAALGKEEFWTELLEAEVWIRNREEIECVEQCAN